MLFEDGELGGAEATVRAAVPARVFSLHVLVHRVRTGGPVQS